MSECETVPVTYRVDVEFEDQSGVFPFGDVTTRAAAEQLLITLAGRTDVKKATLVKIPEV